MLYVILKYCLKNWKNIMMNHKTTHYDTLQQATHDNSYVSTDVKYRDADLHHFTFLNVVVPQWCCSSIQCWIGTPVGRISYNLYFDCKHVRYVTCDLINEYTFSTSFLRLSPPLNNMKSRKRLNLYRIKILSTRYRCPMSCIVVPNFNFIHFRSGVWGGHLLGDE